MTKLSIKTPHGIDFIEISNILAINSIDGNSEIIKTEGIAILVYHPINKFDGLEKFGLIRTHRSWIANMHYVEKLRLNGDKYMIMGKKAIKVKVSRRRLPEIKKCIDELFSVI